MLSAVTYGPSSYSGLAAGASGSFIMPSFDTTLGTLTQVDLFVTGYSDGGRNSLQNLSSIPGTATVTIGDDITITGPSALQVQTHPQTSNSGQLTPFTGNILDFSGTDSIQVVGNSASDIRNSSLSVGLAPYQTVGPGAVTFSYGSVINTFGSSSTAPWLSQTTATMFGFDITIAYQYTSLSLIGLTARPKGTDSVSTFNASFEQPWLMDGTWLWDFDFLPSQTAEYGWPLSQGLAGFQNWTDAQFAGATDADAVPSVVPEGLNSAYSRGGTLSQVLAAAVEPNTRYVLNVEIGHRLDGRFRPYQVQLWAGGQFLAQDDNSLTPAPGQFLTSTVQYQTGAAPALLGQPLEIRLVGLDPGDTAGDKQVIFDNVRLSKLPASTPPSKPAVTLNWNGTIANGIYLIERASSPAGKFGFIKAVDANSTTFTDGAGLKPNTTYYYRIRTNSGGLLSNYSPIVSATTLPPLPAFDSGPRVTSPAMLNNQPADLGTLPGPVAYLDVTFNEAINPGSFPANAVGLKQNTTAIPIGTPIDRGGNVWRIPFLSPFAAGSYTLTLDSKIISDQAGNLLNQNGINANGEPIADQFRARFVVQATSPTDLFKSVLDAMAVGSNHTPIGGVTVITPGFELGGATHDNLLELGEAINHKYGGWLLNYDEAYDGLPESFQLPVPWNNVPGSRNNEVVLVYDWKNESNNDSAGWAEAAADSLFAILVGMGFVNPSAGRDNIVPLHFIGHSFGAAVTSEVVERLATYNVPVDQVTYLDPHDFDQGPLPVDDEQRLWELGQPDNFGATTWRNVSFTDVYYQYALFNESPVGDVIFTIPDGRPIPGAYNVYVTPQIPPWIPIPKLSDNPHTYVWKGYYLQSVLTPDGFLSGDVPGGYGFSRVDHEAFVPATWSRDRSVLRVFPAANTQAAYRVPSEITFQGRVLTQEEVRTFKAQPAVEGLAIYNGGFDPALGTTWIGHDRSVPGWSYHGGSVGDGVELEGDANQSLVLSESHPAIVHNWLYVPHNANSLLLRAQLSGPDIPAEVVEVWLGDRLLGQIPVSSLTVGSPPPFSIPASLVNRAATLTIQLKKADASDQTPLISRVLIDDVAFGSQRSRRPASASQITTPVAQKLARQIGIAEVNCLASVASAAEFNKTEYALIPNHQAVVNAPSILFAPNSTMQGLREVTAPSTVGAPNEANLVSGTTEYQANSLGGNWSANESLGMRKITHEDVTHTIAREWRRTVLPTTIQLGPKKWSELTDLVFNDVHDYLSEGDRGH